MSDSIKSVDKLVDLIDFKIEEKNIYSNKVFDLRNNEKDLSTFDSSFTTDKESIRQVLLEMNIRNIKFGKNQGFLKINLQDEIYDDIVDLIDIRLTDKIHKKNSSNHYGIFLPSDEKDLKVAKTLLRAISTFFYVQLEEKQKMLGATLKHDTEKFGSNLELLTE